MNRTRIVFFVIIGIAVLIVIAGLLVSQVPGWVNKSATGEEATPTPSNDPLVVRIVCALPVEPWVSEAAKKFNAEDHRLEGQKIIVEITPMDGLTAMGYYDREEMNPYPTAWIPDSRYLVDLVNATYKTKRGRDVFLTDGEYRARPIATSLFSWGIYESRAQVLRERYGEVNWTVIHDAAMAKGGWREIGGEGCAECAQWGYFKLVVPNPRKNAAGLVAMVAAAGEYYDKTTITVEDVTNAEFQQWLGELMSAVTDYSSAYSVEDLALFGYSMGDGGQLLESDLLVNMAGIKTRWADPLVIEYPQYLTWFDFPFTVWMGPETTALEKNAALQFQEYLLSPEQQQKALERGLRPANLDVSLEGPDSLFVQWQSQGAMTQLPRFTRMRSPDRDVLLALLRWFDLNVAQ
ncbi:MAG: substrate-binding domain-containing protein [Anaerolineae bacterium]|nr:substrate-binding domain-containing protein [Anaerolineae bacterium]